jgi:hypothetical protein
MGEFNRFGIGRSQLLGAMIVRLVYVFMDLNACFAHRDKGRTLVDPGSTIEIFSSVAAFVERGMSVPAENALGLVMAGVGQGTICDLGR